MEVEEEEEVP